jgi:hypothetical protein
LVYARVDDVAYERLIEVAKEIEFNLEPKSSIDDIEINASETYDIRVILDQEKTEQL